MSLTHKVLVLFSVIMCVVLGMVFFFDYTLSHARDGTKLAAPKAVAAEELLIEFKNFQDKESQYLLADTSASADAVKKSLLNNRNTLEKKLISESEDVKKISKDYFDVQAKLLEIPRKFIANEDVEANEKIKKLYNGDVKNARSKLQDSLTEAYTSAKTNYRAEVEKLEAYIVGKRILSFFFLGFLMLLLVFELYTMKFKVMSPLSALRQCMLVLAKGNPNIEVPGKDRKDEIGEMANSIEVFRQNIIDSERLTSLQEEERRVKELRAQRIEESSLEFEKNVSGVLAELAVSANDMQRSAQTLTLVAQDGKEKAMIVAQASNKASMTSSGVAAASEELSAAIREISTQVQNSSTVTNTASEMAKAVNDAMSVLLQQTASIGEVTNFIQSVADQINLLALNATIESARAGEAGKGFAVVAGEVKNLAGQTSKASGDIAQQVQDIQEASSAAEERIRGIVGKIQEINTNISSIATAIEQQSYATNNIARNVSDTSDAANEVSHNIMILEQGTDQTNASSIEVLQYAQKLALQANQIRVEVSDFLNTVRNV